MNRLTFIHDDQEYVFDPAAGFSVGESVALEEDWNLTVEQLEAHLQAGIRPPLRIVMALLWVAKVRTIAEADGTTFLPAARKYPAAHFDVSLEALKPEEEPANPTPPGGKTPTPGTRTTRRTSAAKRTKTE